MVKTEQIKISAEFKKELKRMKREGETFESVIRKTNFKEYLSRPGVKKRIRKEKKRQEEYNQMPEVREKKKEYSNRPEVKKRQEEYNKRPEVRGKKKEYLKEYYKNHKETLKNLSKRHYKDNRETLLKYSKGYRNSSKGKEKRNEYLQSSKGKKKRNLNQKRRMKEDKQFYISKQLRTLLGRSFRYYSKTGKVYNSKKYGVDFKSIIEHLKPFPKDIKNCQIDHIIPLSRFNFDNPKHIKIAFAPTNHQWLTVKQNQQKGNKLIMPHVYT